MSSCFRRGAERTLILTGLAVLAACASGNGEVKDPPPPPVEMPMLHVASPDWSQQVIYFVLTDRFADGDPSNDDQGKGEFDPADFKRYSGGDLQGVIDKLDYIKGLGATAVWISPPVANQWWDERANFSGNHGYWARNPKTVDEHLGTLDTYKKLSHELHKRGMYLIQDIVPNHMGNFFTWDGPYNPDNPAENFVINTTSEPTQAPELAPFDKIDVRDPAQRDAAIYHFTPQIVDYHDPIQETDWSVNDLDDLNTSNPVVRDALRDAYGYWIKEVGVDAVRIDTVKFVEVPFWNDFLHSDSATAPGLDRVAASTGRQDFLTFGEVYETSQPFEDTAEEKIAKYVGTPAAPALDAPLAYPLYNTIQRVIGAGQPTAELEYRIQKLMDPALIPNPYIVPTFLDNHDVQRFLARSTVPALEQAMLVLMTLPGIPIIYQGTEQGFTEPRAAMFKAGWGSNDQDHFDTNAEIYRAIRSQAEMRRANPVFTRGTIDILRSNSVGAGPFVYSRTLDSTKALVILNTAERRVLLDALPTGLAPGTVLKQALGTGDDMVVRADGSLLLELEPRRSLVLITNGETHEPPAPGVTVTVDTLIEGQTFTSSLAVTGEVTGTRPLKAVIDDDLERAQDITADATGTWTASLPISRFKTGMSTHTVSFYAPAGPVCSPLMRFTVLRPSDGNALDLDDPLGDDTGPQGTYGYPTDASFAGRQMDIEHVHVEAGPTLSVAITMASTSTLWNPPNLFDHVSFNIYFDLPGHDGLSVLPKLQATAPEGFAWTYTHFGSGWDNTIYTTANASASEMGDALTIAPDHEVDRASKTITFRYDAASFGLTSWRDVKLYITTWDYDGITQRYRDLFPAGGLWIMRGPENGAKIMDDVPPITLWGP